MLEEIKKIIVSKMNLQYASPEMQDKIIEETGFMIYQGALTRTMEILSENDIEKLESLLNANKSPNEIFIFLKNTESNFEEILGEEAEKIVTLMKNIDSKIQK